MLPSEGNVKKSLSGSEACITKRFPNRVELSDPLRTRNTIYIYRHISVISLSFFCREGKRMTGAKIEKMHGDYLKIIWEV